MSLFVKHDLYISNTFPLTMQKNIACKTSFLSKDTTPRSSGGI